MDALSILTPPHSDRAKPGRSLTGSVVSCTQLAAVERDRMYALLSTYFVGVQRSQFDADLAEKESVVLLRDHNSGELQGFSTLQRIAMSVDDRDIVAFFSGDTIVAAPYWGETILSRLWSQTVFAEADRIVASQPTTRVFWFLISSGYKTFRFLPVFFRTFYPNPDIPTPQGIQRMLDALCQRKYGEQYDSRAGIVRLAHAAPLRDGVADLTEQRLRDPHVAFFASRNPGHAQGDELACITEITRSNLTRAGLRMVETPILPS